MRQLFLDNDNGVAPPRLLTNEAAAEGVVAGG